MKAARLHEIGKNLSIDDVEIPVPKGRQVLVRVKSAGVCHSDVHYKDGRWGDFTPQGLGFKSPSLPLTLGHEIAGEIAEMGEDVTGLSKNVAVVVNPWEGEGLCDYCSIGEEQMCDNPTRLGITRDGGYAEYVLVPDFRYVKTIKNLSFDEAAPLACAGVTTYRAIKEASMEPGNALLIVGSGGGLGTLAVQISKALGITTIIGVDISDKAIKATKDAGADYAINAIEENADKEIMSLTNGNGVNGVIDFNSSDKTLGAYSKLLAKLGTYVMVGQFGAELNINSIVAIRKSLRFKGTYTGNHRNFVEMINLVENKHIKPNVRYVGGLDKVNEALENLSKLSVTGRQVIRP